MRRQTTLFLFLISVTVLSSYSHSTADTTEPEVILEMLRQFLSEPKVALDVHRLVRAGCKWESEAMWSGGGDEIREGVFLFGGQFTIHFKTSQNKEINLQYGYQVEWSSLGRDVTNVTGGLNVEGSIEC